MCVCVFVHLCVGVCVCVYMCVYVCVYVCMYIYSANPTRCDLDDALACVYVIRKKIWFSVKEPYKRALYGWLSYMVYTMSYIIHKRALCFCKTAL